MALGVYVGNAVLQDAYAEAVLEQVLGGIAHTIFRGDAANKDLVHLQQMQHLAQALPGRIAALKAALLLLVGILSLE